jgi:hypothetical protein
VFITTTVCNWFMYKKAKSGNLVFPARCTGFSMSTWCSTLCDPMRMLHLEIFVDDSVGSDELLTCRCLQNCLLGREACPNVDKYVHHRQFTNLFTASKRFKFALNPACLARVGEPKESRARSKAGGHIDAKISSQSICLRPEDSRHAGDRQ